MTFPGVLSIAATGVSVRLTCGAGALPPVSVDSGAGSGMGTALTGWLIRMSWAALVDTE